VGGDSPKSAQNTIAKHKILNKSEMSEKMVSLQAQLGLPVIDIMNKENDKFILEIIENTFDKKYEYPQ